jgi:hypothetical protein
MAGEYSLPDLLERMYENRIRPAKSSTQPRKATAWCALKFEWTPGLAF